MSSQDLAIDHWTTCDRNSTAVDLGSFTLRGNYNSYQAPPFSPLRTMSSGAHLSRDFFELVKSIGESKSKQEEDRIITREVTTLKKLFAGGKHKPRKKVELLVRLLYVEMLGHDASFGYIHAVQMTAGANLLHKKTAYLVSGQTLHPGHELRFMMVNVSDLEAIDPVPLG